MKILSSFAGLVGAALVVLVFQTDLVKNAYEWDAVREITMIWCALSVGLFVSYCVRELTDKSGGKNA